MVLTNQTNAISRIISDKEKSKKEKEGFELFVGDKIEFSENKGVCEMNSVIYAKNVYKLTCDFNENRIQLSSGKKQKGRFDYELKYRQKTPTMVYVTIAEKTKNLEFESLQKCMQQFFEKTLEASKDSLKHLEIRGSNSNVNLGPLKNLEILELTNVLNATTFVSKITKPLNVLSIFDKNPRNLDFSKCEKQLREVRESLILSANCFTKDNYSKIRASQIEVPIGNMDEFMLANIIEKWRNSDLKADSKRQQCITWNIDKSKYFHLKMMFKHLGTDWDSEGDRYHEEKNKAGKVFIFRCKFMHKQLENISSKLSYRKDGEIQKISFKFSY
ncbi:unnamed protein product [Caenorhabditis angaria]|uniref:Uncharacterized protein n=1 Tax=Caenorhabditis angaria TaxID=860376 RepID=A0A9P1MTI1_9PELO|nr:unnamed protein product [Caenorhabditis angaria]